MHPKRHSKKLPRGVTPPTHIAMTFKIPQGVNAQEFAAKEMFKRLGLGNGAAVAAFSDFRNLSENFYDFTVKDFRSRNLFAPEIAASKNKSFVSVVLYVPVELVAHVNSYLQSVGHPVGVALQGVTNRAYDAARQVATGVRDTAIGIGRDVADGINDKNQGALKTADGLIQMATAKPFSPQMGNAFKTFGEGIGQINNGFLKFNMMGTDLTTLDAFLMGGGRVVSGWQTIYGFEQLGRALNGTERINLQKVFASSLDYDAIRVKEGYAGIFSAGYDDGITLFHNNRAITHGSTIYLKYENTANPQGMTTLVHEATHVWQHQNGGDSYLARAAHAQSPLGNGYEYFDAVKQNRAWVTLNPEQQAHLIEEAYLYGYFNNQQWNNSKITQSDQAFLIQYVDNVLPLIRAGIGAR